MVITTFDPDGTAHDRVVSRPEYDGGETAPHVAVHPDEAERDLVDSAHPVGLVFRVLTGFPPRRFVRLDPVY